MTMLAHHIQLVTTVHPVVFAMLAIAVDFVLINFLMAHLVAVACNANLKCVHNMIINKTFAIHALVITLRHQILMDWRGLHIVTRIINIVQMTYLVRCRKQLGQSVMEIISNVTRASVIKIHSHVSNVIHQMIVPKVLHVNPTDVFLSRIPTHLNVQLTLTV